jgi:hypothetical protein
MLATSDIPSPLYAANDIPTREQMFSQMSAMLPGDAADQGHTIRHSKPCS